MLWAGLALAIIAFVSYFGFFARFPITRDVPWASWLLFAIAVALLVGGFRRAPRRILGGSVMIIGIAIALLFIGATTFGTKLPVSHPPAVGQKAPDFALVDSTHRRVTLSQIEAAAPRGVLLIFYRGYW